MKRYMLDPLFYPESDTTTGTTTTATTSETIAGSEKVETPPTGKTDDTTTTDDKTDKTDDTTTTTTTTTEAPKPWTVSELAIPANSPFDATDVDAIFAEGQALGLTKEQTQVMFDGRAKVLDQVRGQWLQEAKADPELGGVKWEQTVKDVQAGVAWLFPNADERAAMNAWFNKTGLGNHITWLRTLSRIGAAGREDRPMFVGRAGGEPDIKPTTEVLFKTSK